MRMYKRNGVRGRQTGRQAGGGSSEMNRLSTLRVRVNNNNGWGRPREGRRDGGRHSYLPDSTFGKKNRFVTPPFNRGTSARARSRRFSSAR